MPGDKQCSGSTPQTCDAAGAWVNGSPCTYSCSGGECLVAHGTEGSSCDQMLGNECQTVSCCQSNLVPGGTFPMGRSLDGSDAWSGTTGSGETPEHDATVDSYYLDTYEVTVGRFRAFVDSNTWLPAANAGEHPKIPGSGWNTDWNSWIPDSKAAWNTALHCSTIYPYP